MIHHLCDSLPFDIQMYKRLLKFVDSLQKSENTEGSGSIVSGNVSHICHSFNISCNSMYTYQVFMNCIKEQKDEGIQCELIVAGNIKDLLHMRDTHDKFLMKDLMQCMLDYCCNA